MNRSKNITAPHDTNVIFLCFFKKILPALYKAYRAGKNKNSKRRRLF